MVKEITAEQVAKQKYDKRKMSSPCWIIIHNDVYDVSKFLHEHPGGADALTDYAGKDATRAFEDVGHSDDARELMKKYKIGYLPAEQRNTFIDPCCPGYSKRRKVDTTGSFRSFDGSSPRSLTPKSSFGHRQAKAEPRVHAIVVPRESPWSYWWLLAAAVVLLGGAFAVRKKMAA